MKPARHCLQPPSSRRAQRRGVNMSTNARIEEIAAENASIKEFIADRDASEINNNYIAYLAPTAEGYKVLRASYSSVTTIQTSPHTWYLVGGGKRGALSYTWYTGRERGLVQVLGRTNRSPN